MITFVAFRSPVTIGSQGRESWSVAQEALVGSNGGKTTVVDKGAFLLFTYEAGKVKQRIRVPMGNVGFITETGDDK